MAKKIHSCPYCGNPLKVESTIKKASVKKVIKPKEEKKFSSEESIDKFVKDNKLYIKIMGEFFLFRGDIYLSEEEFRHNVSANIKAARVLSSLKFEIDFYKGLFLYTQSKLAEIQKTKVENVFITNLNTTTKFIQQFRSEYSGYKNG